METGTGSTVAVGPPAPPTGRGRRHRALVVLASVIVLGLPVLVAGSTSSRLPPPQAAAPLPPPQAAIPSPTTSTAPTSTAAPVPPSRAAAVLAAAGNAATAGQYRLSVLDLTTGTIELGPGALDPVYSASLAKLVVAVDIMGRRSEVAVTAADRDLLRRALSASDDPAMSALWDRFDGYGAVARVADRYGLRSARAPSDPGEWGSVEISARDVTVLYWAIYTQLERADSRFVTDALDSATSQAADGFNQNFGVLAAGGLGTKQGWACCYSGVRVMHSAGVLGRRYVLVLMSTTTSSSYSQPRLALDAAARAAAAAA